MLDHHPLDGCLGWEVSMPAVAEGEPSQRPCGRYPSQSCEDAAALVSDPHRAVAEVAGELALAEQTLGNPVRQERPGPHRPG